MTVHACNKIQNIQSEEIYVHIPNNTQKTESTPSKTGVMSVAPEWLADPDTYATSVELLHTLLFWLSSIYSEYIYQIIIWLRLKKSDMLHFTTERFLCVFSFAETCVNLSIYFLFTLLGHGIID